MGPARLTRRASLAVVAASLVLAGCGGSEGTDAGGDPTTDKLAQVLARGTLILSTDLEYPPQSFGVKGAQRVSDAKCASNQLTAPEVSGYDAETGKAVAAVLGVEPCFVTPSWTEITGGNWGDRWDVSWGNGAINADRMERLHMTQPYEADDQLFYVRRDSPIRDPMELSGRKVGACADCSHQLYLEKTLEIPGVEIAFFLDDPEVVLFDVERSGLEAVAKGDIAAFICSGPVGDEAIEDGLALRPLARSPFPLYSTGFVDKSSGLSDAAFVERIDEIVQQLHADGTLKRLSVKYLGKDFATKAGEFDVDSIGQSVT